MSDALPPLFEEVPEVFEAAFDRTAPWSLLGEALDQVLAAQPEHRFESAILPEVHLVGEHIVIGKGVRIHPGCVLEGPLFIGDDSEIRPGAYLRGGVWVGRGCIVGASTEIKRGILFDGARAPHLNYVGDSILGRGVNLGAGTILSNFRHDGREIRLPQGGGFLPTGRRKLGAVLGDGVKTGCNCVLYPGCVVGRGTSLYPGVQLRAGIWPESSIVKLRQTLDIVAAVT